jgi:hypothetical protein
MEQAMDVPRRLSDAARWVHHGAEPPVCALSR